MVRRGIKTFWKNEPKPYFCEAKTVTQWVPIQVSVSPLPIQFPSHVFGKGEDDPMACAPKPMEDTEKAPGLILAKP